MTNKKRQVGFLSVVLAMFGLTYLAGCTTADALALQTFVADLLRNAGAALLL